MTSAPLLAVVLAACPWIAEPAWQPFELYTHCGVDGSLIDFDGSFWEATGPGPLSDGSGNPPPRFNNPTDRGSIGRIGEDTAVFVSSQGVRVELRRLNGRPAVIPCR